MNLSMVQSILGLMLMIFSLSMLPPVAVSFETEGRMRCMLCGGHATFTHTLFKGTTPHKVNLCDPCVQKSRANERLAKIKAAHDHAAKGAAVDEFLSALGKGETSTGT